jgi:NaMN:DMB phosphoribosyltransferase
MGEQLILGSLAAGGTTAAAGMLVFGRAKVDAVLRWLRRR